ncbi:hypothetical protein ACA910_019505 [Epithemia clementina (nom. ined.)]
MNDAFDQEHPVDEDVENVLGDLLLDEELSKRPEDAVAGDLSSSSSSSFRDGGGDILLAQKETRIVHSLRLGVLLFLLLSAGGIVFAVYHYTTNMDQNQFEVAVHNYATKAIEALQVNTEGQLMAMDQFASQLTATAIATNSTWPFVTIPNFALLVCSTVAEIKALSMLANPVIMDNTREAWNAYVLTNGPSWLREELAFQAAGGYNQDISVMASNFSSSSPTVQEKNASASNAARHLQENTIVSGDDKPQQEVTISFGFGSDIFLPIVQGDGTLKFVSDQSGEPYCPMYQNSPPVPFLIQNYNMISANSGHRGPMLNCIFNHTAVTGGVLDVSRINANITKRITDSVLATWGRSDEVAVEGDPVGYYYYPVHQDLFDKTSRVVSVLMLYVHWRQLFMNLLPPDAVGIVAVFENTCAQTFSYKISGASASYLGPQDMHDSHYDYLVHSTRLTPYFNHHRSKLYYGVPLSEDAGCQYTLRVYPSRSLEETYESNFPIIASVVVALIFVFAIVVFVAYDCFVEMRQRVVMQNALRTGAIVSSMFPFGFKDRLMEDGLHNKGKNAYLSNKGHIKSFLDNGDSVGLDQKAKPLADLFPSTTVMFADIVNFTSWASQRDPEQVFMLLQCIYHTFDIVARRCKVWKVETVGDCYVAVAGIPDAQPEHAVIMACFANSCLKRFAQATRQLETSLGPDTGDLKMRFGLHSGPCIAGVLRGERSRFQLFGDTVNVAARMESSGEPDRIQVSKATAELLKEAGKEHWLTARDKEVNIKGKGFVQTYFLVVTGSRSVRSAAPSTSDTSFFNDATRNDLVNHTSTKKTMRLVEWNVKTLSDRLRAVVARSMAVKGKRKSIDSAQQGPAFVRQGDTCLDEMKDVISMPPFDPRIAAKESDPDKVDLGEKVVSQLHLYTTTIASMYHDENAFHNFSHASHVIMSVDKLLKRIVAPDINLDQKDVPNESAQSAYVGLQLHDYTHGITSDPLTQFAIVLSALVHNVDHHGISNAQLSKENPKLAQIYRDKSIAEQNSINLAWDILMRKDFQDLRHCIYTDQNELGRFRQTVINVVLATDIFDKELNEQRKQRWNNAFSEKSLPCKSRQHDTNVKATIVIEHLIQASDVAHTMQHWHGEIGFFDNYIIPLAKKLKECNVFGVFSDEYLSYAKANRKEWEQKGQAIVAELVEKYKGKSEAFVDAVGKIKGDTGTSSTAPKNEVGLHDKEKGDC